MDVKNNRQQPQYGVHPDDWIMDTLYLDRDGDAYLALEVEGRIVFWAVGSFGVYPTAQDLLDSEYGPFFEAPQGHTVELIQD